MRFFAAAALCLLCLSAQPSQNATKPSALDKPTFEAYLRHLLAIPSDVQVKVDDPKPGPLPDLNQVDVHLSLGNRSQDETFYVSKDGQKLIRGLVYNMAENPFQQDLNLLKTDLSPSFGTAGAPVTIVAFGDFQCPNCKDEALAIRANLEKAYPGKVRYYFKDFPLEQIHNWAMPAAIAGRCVFKQDPAAFWKYYDWVYNNQSDITAENFKSKFLDFAKSENLDSLQLGRCIDTRATEPEVEKEITEARALRIDATPTIFINGRRLIGNYPWSALDQIIAGELNYQKSSKAADEKCCEVSIPNPLKK